MHLLQLSLVSCSGQSGVAHSNYRADHKEGWYSYTILVQYDVLGEVQIQCDARCFWKGDSLIDDCTLDEDWGKYASLRCIQLDKAGKNPPLLGKRMALSSLTLSRWLLLSQIILCLSPHMGTALYHCQPLETRLPSFPSKGCTYICLSHISCLHLGNGGARRGGRF